MTVELLFWLAVFLIFYAYLGYPLLLALLGKVVHRPVAMSAVAYQPGVTVILPVHNEERVIDAKLKNLDALGYPRNRLEILIVSDGSTDRTRQRIQDYRGDLQIRFLELPQRQGKAAALNLGLRNATSEILVFSDASIMLEADALHRIVQPFQDDMIGCVSGEDHISGGGGEGLYGRYELFLRNLESRLCSIAGASGSFYAMRTSLCKPFLPGMAPDFLSVLVTVESGYRAITEPLAIGFMASTKSTSGEFTRKVRTLIRGMTALWHARALLNPFRSGMFALVLWSHKLMRWSVPWFMILALVANLFLLHNMFYLVTFLLQLAMYGLVLLGLLGPAAWRESPIIKLPLFLAMVNFSILVSWLRYLTGTRLEIWEPTRR
jgi:cellulose synthase/poly-beta-1,6-N-acetylglucosamine synthase-like glycosyltransferase